MIYLYLYIYIYIKDHNNITVGHLSVTHLLYYDNYIIKILVIVDEGCWCTQNITSKAQHIFDGHFY